MRLRNMSAGGCLLIGLFLAGAGGAVSGDGAGPHPCGQGPHPPRDHALRHPRGPGQFLEQHSRELGLDETTRESIRAVAEASRAEAEATEAEIEDAREDLHALLSQETVDEAEVMAAVDALGELETALHRHKLATMLRVRALLTPEQRSELMRLREDRHARHEQFRAQVESTLEACAEEVENLCDARGHRALRCLHEQSSVLSSGCARAVDELPPPPQRRRGRGGSPGRERSGLHGPGVAGVE